jgi:UDP-hydrolysing UDP-N-acetyl-D-glucosamine 2-epimerase
VKKVAVLTTSRADFGLQRDFIASLVALKSYEVDVVVSGSHFLDLSGESLREVRENLAGIGARLVAMPVPNQGSEGRNQGGYLLTRSETLASMIDQTGSYLQANRLDAVVFLGDRWELWGFVYPAYLAGIPLFHLSGGETTAGALDDFIRHALTKLSSIHLVAAEPYGRAVSQMGEEDWRISVCGEPGLDRLSQLEPTSKTAFCLSLGLEGARPLILLALHPATLESNMTLMNNLEALGHTIDALSDFSFVMTAPGSEPGSQLIENWGRAEARENENFVYVESLGRDRFVEAISHSSLMVGNSSSGIVEAPTIGTRTLNLGSRQSGRLRADSVKDLEFECGALVAEIKRMTSLPDEGRESFANPYDPFRDGQNTARAVKSLCFALNQYSSEVLVAKKLVFDVKPREWMSPL